jgi:alkylation response protein AidB-like acyl-CoA dehydrogenase
MDLTLSEEHPSLRATVEDFARKEVAPVIGELYERGEFPYEIVAKMGARGLFGLPIAEEYGGMGGDYFALYLALEELARVDSSVAITLQAGVSLGAMPIYRFGTGAQKQRWLPALAAGEKLGAFGLTEPGGGSDAGATRTTARLDGENWVINGSKAFITNSGTALVTVTALTGERQISSIIVRRARRGALPADGRAVSRRPGVAQVLSALTPAALELSVTAARQFEARRAEVGRIWRQRLERAEFLCDRARRQYQLAEPENRPVAQ